MIGPLGVIPVSRLRRAPGITASRLTGPGAADQDNIALLSDEVTAGEVIDERRIARRAWWGPPALERPLMARSGPPNQCLEWSFMTKRTKGWELGRLARP